MIYYQVTLKHYDTKNLFNTYQREIIINEELYTPREYERLKEKHYWNFEEKDFNKIQWNKHNTVFVFGKRVKKGGI
jgi:hypothetical protein